MKVSLSERCFDEFVVLIHRLTGITVGKNRTFMVEGRLRKRIMALKLTDYESYLEFVRRDKTEQNLFVDLITTNETYFYRTPRIWEYIEKKFLGKWFEAHPKRVFMAWSAASSSGEEAHTLAILCQAFKDKHPSFSYQILGTDISSEMVALCKTGEFAGRSIESFKKARPELFSRYMKSDDGVVYKAVNDIRSRMRFQQHNLFQSLQSGVDRFDLVLARNVLIYFKADDQEKVLSRILPRMSEDGVLIIGESESLSQLSLPLKSVEPLVYNIDQASLVKGKAG